MVDVSLMPHNISRFLVPGIFLLLLALESLRPLRRVKRRRGSRYVVNGALTGLGFLAGVLAVRPAALGGALWAERHSFGLLNLVGLPLWVQVAVGVLLMDLTFYYWLRLSTPGPCCGASTTSTTPTRTWT